MGLKSTMEQWTIEREHHEVHEGEMFGSAFFINLTGGEFKKVILLTGAKFVHYYFQVAVNGPMLIKLYEDSYYSATAGPVTSINLNRGKSNVALMQCYSTPTITTDGTCIFSRFVVGQTGGGVAQVSPAAVGAVIRPGTEIILDSSSTYHFYLENSAAAAITLEFSHEFYEESGVEG